MIVAVSSLEETTTSRIQVCINSLRTDGCCHRRVYFNHKFRHGPLPVADRFLVGGSIFAR